MGKRSDFPRVGKDAYDTPAEAVAPLLPWLASCTVFAEPCAGAGLLVDALRAAGHVCAAAYDIDPRRADVSQGDALTLDWSVAPAGACIITNPPWTRELMHPMILAFSDACPTWLLFDADWAHTRQALQFKPRLRRIVSVGRVKWIAGSKMTGKDNCAWHLFTRPAEAEATFHMREAA